MKNIIFSYDYVLLRDGNSSSSPSIGQYCGTNKPDGYVSMGSALFIKFKTDGATVRKGFNMTYEAVKGNSQYSGFSYYMVKKSKGVF